MKAKLQMILAKVETTYGTDSTPAAATDWIAVQNIDVNPVEMDTDDQMTVSNTFGQDEKIVGAIWSTISFDMPLRGGGTYAINRLPLSFANVGEAVVGHTITFTGVGTGSVSCTAYDALDNSLLHPIRELPYADGEQITSTITLALQELNGEKDWRIRIKAIPTSSPTASAEGVTIEPSASRFWVLARAATRRNPVVANSQRFDYTGAVQQFTVPDGVQEVSLEVVGASGRGGSDGGLPTVGGRGGKIEGSLAVTPGSVLDVYVGGISSWPNGGAGDSTASGNSGGPGGGSSDVRPSGTAYTSAVLMAGGGGGGGFRYIGAAESGDGGNGGFFTGDDGQDPIGAPTGATQFTGGVGGNNGSDDPGDSGSANQGGAAGDTTNGFAEPGGGGGGGWYGGGGAAKAATNGPGGGGGGGAGGSGYSIESVLDLIITDGGNAAGEDGYVIFSWDTPE